MCSIYKNKKKVDTLIRDKFFFIFVVRENI